MLSEIPLKVLRFWLLCLSISSSFGQQPGLIENNGMSEMEFTDAVALNFPSHDLMRLSLYALDHPSIAIPILTASVKARLDDNHESAEIVQRTTGLIGYAASSFSMDAIDDLCRIDESRFSPLVASTLNYAISREREFEVAAYGAARYVRLRKQIGQWLEGNLEFPFSELLLARAVLKHDEDRNGADTHSLLELLNENRRARLNRAVESVQVLERERTKKQ